MTQPEDAPTLAPSATEAAPDTTPVVARQPGHPNLVRYATGAKPAHLSRPRITRRTLMDDLRAVLSAKDGLRQRKLAESIIDNAIDGNGACLSFIAERLAPVVRDEGQGRTVFEGIKLEVVGSSDGQRTTIALVRGSESHRDTAAQNLSASGESDQARVIEGVVVEPSESQDS